MKYDADGDATIEADEEYHFVYDTSWRAIMTRRYTDTASSIPAYKDRTIYHNAGLGGYGGSGYTDSVLMRDADMTNSWSGAADGTLEDRQYYSNNWRGDVVAILDDTGRMIEQVRYTPYGVPFALPAGDSDSDGDWDGTDVTNIGGGYDIREDSDLDGDADFDDFTHSNNRAGGSAMSLGWKTLSSAYCANRKGYASYEHDAAAPATLAHVRYRVYNFTLGRWIQRDPAGYVDGPNLYGYVGARAVETGDAFGLCSGCSFAGSSCAWCMAIVDVVKVAECGLFAHLACVLAGVPTGGFGFVLCETLVISACAILMSHPTQSSYGTCAQLGFCPGSSPSQPVPADPVPLPPASDPKPITTDPTTWNDWVQTCAWDSTGRASCYDCCWNSVRPALNECSWGFMDDVKACYDKHGEDHWAVQGCINDAYKKYAKCYSVANKNWKNCMNNCRRK